MYMTFRRLRAWLRVGGGFFDYGQQSSPATVLTINFHHLNICHFRWWLTVVWTTQLPVMDVSARTTMKGAAKCDKHCELQDSVNQQKVERILLFRVIPESMFASVSFVFSAGRVTQVSRFRVFMFQCSIRCIDTCVLVVLDMRNVEHLLQEWCYVWSSRPCVFFLP